MINIAISAGSFSIISSAILNIILTGSNPSANQQRTLLQNIPERFFVNGIGLTCDEFSVAIFIEGGTGAQSICAF